MTGRAALPALAVTVVLLALAVVGAAGVGDWSREGAARDQETLPTEPPPTLPTDSATPAPEESLPPVDPVVVDPVVLRTIVYGVVGLLVVGLVLLLVRMLLQVRRGQGVGPLEDRMVSAVEGDEVDVPELQDGIAQARSRLAEDREPHDAVLRAWVALEASAERAGARRNPAQTPTEFTAAVLARTGADADAVATLRGLYLRARFSEGSLSEADADHARAALDAVAASWSSTEASR